MKYTKKGLMFLLVMCFMAIAVGFNVKVKAVARSTTFTITSTSAVSITGNTTGITANYSSTYNTKCQLTSGKSMTLTVSGLGGCTLKSVELSMKSNKSAGSGSLSVVSGDDTLWEIAAGTAFNDNKWYGSYTQTYSPVSKQVDYTVAEAATVVIVVAADVNSLYVESYTLTYDDGKTNPEVIITNPTDDIKAGEQSSLSINYNNLTNPSISWTSNNTNIATVSNDGVVTGVAMGTVTITATATGAEGNASDSVTIKVWPSNTNRISVAEAIEIAQYSGDANSIYLYSCRGTVKKVDSGSQFVLTDDLSDIIVYKGSHGMTEGMLISVNGTLRNYNNTTPEFTGTVNFGYAISFDSAGGPSVETQFVEKNEKVTAPSAIERDRYNFVGWFNGEEQWDFENDVVVGEMTLTAKWLDTAASTIPTNLNGINAWFDMGYRYNATINTNNFELVTDASQLAAGKEVVIVSKFNDKYYAMGNTIESSSLKGIEINVTNNRVSYNVDACTVWTLGTVEDGWSLGTKTMINNELVSRYLSASSNNTNVSLQSSPVKFAFGGVENKYLGVGGRALIINNSGLFKNYGSSNINGTGYASETYVFVRDASPSTFADVDFRFKLGIDEGINELIDGFDERVEEGDIAIGIEVSDGYTTVKYEIGANNSPINDADDDGRIYVVIDLGDVLNNPSRLNREFTVRAYAYIEGDYFYSSQEKTYSVYTAVQAYKTQGAPVDGLVNILKRMGYSFN